MSNLISDNKNSWCDLNKWFLDQEIYFKKKKIESDEDKISYIVLNLDVRHWVKLQKYLNNNQQKTLSYQHMKNVLTRELKKKIEPQIFNEYDKAVETSIDKMAISNLNLKSLETWLKKLRDVCNGGAKNGYLVTKILSRLTYSNKEREIKNLLKEIEDEIKITESRIVNGVIGKKTKKKISNLQDIRTTILELDY